MMKFHPLCTHLETYELDCLANASSIIHLNQSSTRDHQVLVQHHHRAQTTNAEKVRLVIMYRFSLLETSSPIRSRYEQCSPGLGNLWEFLPSLNQKKTKTDDRPGFCCISPAKNFSSNFLLFKNHVSTGWLKKFLIAK